MIPQGTPIFKQIKTSVSPVTGCVTVEWKVSSGYKPVSSSLLFYVEVAYSGGSWERLNPLAPVVNDSSYVDIVKRSFNILNDVYYRVIMYDNGVPYISIPEKIGSTASRQELRLANEVIRRKYFELVKMTGMKGYLLRRKDWGTHCTCYDVDLSNAPSGTCSNCYGVGFVDGYYPAIEFWIADATKAGTEKRRDGQTGIELSHIKKARCIPYPKPQPDDIWVNAVNGTRWRIFPETVEECFYRSTSIVEIITMEQLPPTAVEYDIPITLEDPNNWTTGISLMGAQGDMQVNNFVTPPVVQSPSTTTVVQDLIAGADLQAYQLVRINDLGGVVLVTAMDMEQLDTCIGMTITSALNGESVQVVTFGRITNPLWSLTAGSQVYIGVDGAISYTPDHDGLAFEQAIGLTETSTDLLIRIRKGVLI